MDALSQIYLPHYGPTSCSYATSTQGTDYGGVSEAAVALAHAECHILSNAGFSASEIARFQQLRRDYVKNTSSHLSATNRRYKFGSWLEAMIFGRTYPEWTRYE